MNRAAVMLLPALVLVVPASMLAGLVTQDPGALIDWWASAPGWSLLWETMWFCSIAAGSATITAAFARCALVRAGAVIRAVSLLVLLVPLLLPASLVAAGWISLFAPGGLGWRTGSMAISIFEPPAAAILVGWRYVGLAALLMLMIEKPGGDRALDRLLVRSTARRLWSLRVRPLLIPMLAAFGLVVVLTLNEPIMPGLLMVRTIGTQILVEYSARLDHASALALATMPATLGAVLLLLVVRVGRRADWPSGRHVQTSRHVGAYLGLPVLLLLVVAPLLALLRDLESISAPLQALWDVWPDVGASLVDSAVSASLVTVTAGVMAGAWARGRAPWVASLVVLPALAGTPLALGVIDLGHLVDPGRGAPVLWLHVYLWARCAPVITIALMLAWRGQREPSSDAADLMIPSAGARLVRIWLPRHAFSLAVSWVVTAMLALAEIEGSIMLSPPGRATLGVTLYSMIHTAPAADVAALAVGSLLIFLLPIGIIGGAWTMLARNRS